MTNRHAGIPAQPRGTDELLELVLHSPWIVYALQSCCDLGMKDFYVAAGALTQIVWNHLCGLPIHNGIKDIDIVYFDSAHSRHDEKVYERTLNDNRPLHCVPFDVKNQALVHTWYEDKFGYPIRPYSSTEDGMNTWLSAVAVGVRQSPSGYSVYAPFGTDDVFAMRIRPNPRQITPELYSQMAASFSRRWPQVQVELWGDRPE